MKQLICLLILGLAVTGCSEDGDLNVFSVEQDLDLGRQTDRQIRDNPADFPVLAAGANAAAYAYLQDMVNEIVERGDVPYADVFPYKVTLIDQPTENAFATPGGFIYVYTGLVRSLNHESELAGVLAHEIAHAAERHSTDQLTKQYGFSTLVSLLTGGDPGLLSQVAGSLLSLRFSRSDEAEADERSVDYLCNTRFAANGAAGFFQTIGNAGSPPEFLSSHPSPENRVADINAHAAAKSCEPATPDGGAFRAFKAQLAD